MLVPSWFTVWPRVCEGVILSVNKEHNDHLMEGLLILVGWCNFYLVEAHLCVGAFLPRCLDCLGPGGVGVGSCLSARRFLFKGIVVLCKSLYDKTWHSRKFSQHRPLWLHCTTGECNFSKYTRKHNVKNINKNQKKNKNKLTALYWPPPAPPPPPRNKGLLLPDSGAVSRLLVMIFFWSPFLAAL